MTMYGTWMRAFVFFGFVGLSAGLGLAQSTPQVADEATVREATTAYGVAKRALTDLDYTELAKTLADNRRPMLPKAQQTDAAVSQTAEKLKTMAKDIERTRQLLLDAEALKPKFGSATMQETAVRDMRVVLVKVSLVGTSELAEKLKLGKGGWTTDDQGNLAVLMVKHNGNWYWNPFGW